MLRYGWNMTLIFPHRWLAPVALITSLGCTVNLPSGGGGAGTSNASTGTVLGNGTTGAGMPCGNATCEPATEYCGFEPGTCDGPKACHPYGHDCSISNAACGCDGKNYAGACTALHNAGGIVGSGACNPPAGQFNCTYQDQVPVLCTIATQYCRVTPAGALYGLDCVDLPMGCTGAGATCQCADGGFQFCVQNYCGADAGALTVLCP